MDKVSKLGFSKHSPFKHKKMKDKVSIADIRELNGFTAQQIKNCICIYKITSPSGKNYIGQTTNLCKRLNRYINAYNMKKTKGQVYLFNSFIKYGIISHKFEILHTFELYNREKLSESEKYYIKVYNSFNKEKGLNLTAGGEGKLGRKMSEENKRKLIEASKKRIFTEEMRQRMSLSRKKYVLEMGGHKHTEEYKEKMRQIKKGIPVPPEIAIKRALARKKVIQKTRAILQYDLTGVFIKETNVYKLREEGYSKNNIYSIYTNLRGKTKTSCGYIWTYKN